MYDKDFIFEILKTNCFYCQLEGTKHCKMELDNDSNCICFVELNGETMFGGC